MGKVLIQYPTLEEKKLYEKETSTETLNSGRKNSPILTLLDLEFINSSPTLLASSRGKM
jgi:hypothetical protein